MKLIIIFIFAILKAIGGNPIGLPNIDTPKIEPNSKSIEFNLTLPNKDILKINISFVMMKESLPLETIENNYEYQLDDENSMPSTFSLIDKEKEESTTTTDSPITTDETPSQKLITVDDTIELIEKETNIGGIIESKQTFYRHFNLQYANVDILIRCT